MRKLSQLVLASSLFIPPACATGQILEHSTEKAEQVQNIQSEVGNQTQKVNENCTTTKIETLAEDENGIPIVKSFKFETAEGINAERYVYFNDKGNHIYDFYSEKRLQPELTPDDYIKMLAKVFNSPARWQAFSKYFIVYTYDSPDRNNQLLIGTKKDHDDYWQLPQETVLRYNEKGQALGDCDDYAFLAQEILKQQGIKSVVIDMPRHAVTVWVNYDLGKQKYHGYSIGTYGYDHNGNRYTNTSPDPTKAKGYNNAITAINSVLKKFKVADSSSGVSQSISFQIPGPEIPIIYIGGYYNRHQKANVFMGKLINPVDSVE